MSLQGESTLTNAEKISEAQKHVNYLMDHLEEMNENERKFVTDTAHRFEQYGERTFISNKQLFWLRDLNTKY